MNSFYERHQDDKKTISVALGPNFAFSPHFHQKIEIFFLIKGEYGVSRNGKNYRLKSGDIMFFDSYDVHAYDKRDCEVEGLVIIIPPDAAEKFFSRKDGKRVLNPIVSDFELCNKLYALGKEFIEPKNVSKVVKSGAAELILSLLEERLDFDERKFSDETTLAQNLLVYINENFKSDLNLSVLAKKFGYSPEHISRVFHRYVNSGLPDYVNGLRLNYMDNAINVGNKKNITDLLFDAGFKSIQSYYRAKNKRKALV